MNINDILSKLSDYRFDRTKIGNEYYRNPDGTYWDETKKNKIVVTTTGCTCCSYEEEITVGEFLLLIDKEIKTLKELKEKLQNDI